MKELSLGTALSILCLICVVTTEAQECLGGPGCLDSTFGNGGIVATSVNYGTAAGWANAVAIQSDGKIVIAAQSGNFENTSASDCCVLRYLPDGALDDSFGVGGVVRFALTSAADKESLHSLAIQPDGKILAAGKVGNETAVVRLNPNGSLDPGFGIGGAAVFTFTKGKWAVPTATVALSDGRIVVGLNTNNSGFGFARFSSIGQFDTTFSGDGKLAVSGGSTTALLDMIVQPDGKYLASGIIQGSRGSSGQFGLMRVNINGTLDTTFGSSGKVITDFGGSWSAARNVLMDVQGKIVAGGDWLATGQSFVFVRYLPNGQIDSTFGTLGKTVFESSNYRRMTGMALQFDGKIVGSGWDRDPNTSNYNVAILRTHTNGTLDTSFGNQGMTITDYNGMADDGLSMASQADGRFVVAGGINGSGPGTSIGLYRYLP